MSGSDPIELFKHLDPTRQIASSQEAARTNEAILASVLAHSRRPVPTSRGSRRKPWMIGGGLIVVVLATAAFVVLRREPVSDPLGIACMASTDPSGDVVALPAGEDPVEACRRLWTDGTLGTGEPPPLAACINQGGAAAVFPGDSEICSRLGLAGLEPGFTPDQRRIVQLEGSLAETFGAQCFAEDEAVTETQRQLDASGLTGWTVYVPDPFGASARCAGSGIDLEQRRVLLGGVREP